MELKPKPPTTKGPVERFTGEVFFDPIVSGEEPSRLRINAVRFTPGARTAWHCHTLGQTLYVTDGEGRVAARGGSTLHVRAGDIVYTPPEEWHWHGAAPDHFMSHLSLTEGVAPDDERPESQWGAHVTDAEYHAEG